MRSQQEILQKIDGLAKMLFKPDPKIDPFFQQYRILVHKLNWEQGKQFIDPKDRNPNSEDKWNELNRLDKATLIKEITEQIDLGAMHVVCNDPEMAFYCATGLLAQFWLLGQTKDKVLNILFKEYMSEKSIYLCSEPLFDAVCNELQIDWKRLKLRYQGGMFSKVVDQQGKHFKMELDQAVTEAIKEQEEK